MAGLIDVDAERERLGRQKAKAEADAARIRAKLDNPDFVNNAPAEVVTKSGDQLADLESRIAQLDEQLSRLESVH